MTAKIFLISILITFNLLPQTYQFPYPIIFVHGLKSEDTKWDETISYLKSLISENQLNYVFHGVLNAQANITRLEGQDAELGTIDDDVIFPEYDENGNLVNRILKKMCMP